MATEKEQEIQFELEQGRRCPVYAIQPMKIMGMDTGTAIGALVVLGISKPFMVATFGGNFGNIIAFLAAVVYVVLINKATKGQERGFIVHRVAVFAGSPFARKYLPWMGAGMRESWKNAGCVPPASITNRYEV